MACFFCKSKKPPIEIFRKYTSPNSNHIERLCRDCEAVWLDFDFRAGKFVDEPKEEECQDLKSGFVTTLLTP